MISLKSINNLMFKLFGFILLIRLFNGAIATRKVCRQYPEIESSYSLNSSVIISKLTTKNVIYLKFKWKGTTDWPKECAIMVVNVERDVTVFKYMPFTNKSIKESKRVRIFHVYKSLNLQLIVGFSKNEDDESRWAIDFQMKLSDNNPKRLCTFFVRADQTPFVTLEHERLGKGRGVISKYHEEDKIKIVCTLNKANPSTPDPSFNLALPYGSTTEDVSDKVDKYKKSVILVLTKNIHYKPVTCWVSDGDNVTDTTICSFSLKKMQKKSVRHTTVAISIAVFLCILLFVMTFLGAYLLIVKQRADTTNDLIKHHTQVSKMKANMMMLKSMNKVKSSRLSTSERQGGGSSRGPSGMGSELLNL